MARAADGNIRTTLIIDGERTYEQKMNSLYGQQKLLKSEMQKVTASFSENDSTQKKLSGQMEVLTQQIATQKEIVAAIEAEWSKNAESGEANEEATRKLETQLNKAKATLSGLEKKLEDSSKKLKESSDAVKQNAEKWKESGKILQDAGEKIEKVGSKISGTGNKLSIGVTAPILAAGTAAAKSAVDFESAFAGVTKTVDGTDEQLGKLRDDILDMSEVTPTAANDIAGVAEAAGQLGIKVDDISKFSKVMIDLGESTNLSAEDAAMSLAKFANITDMSSDEYERLGSTIVDLGNNFATTESDITDMATRLASTGNIVGLSKPQIMAVATALSSVGIEAEAGGSAISRLMKNVEVSVKSYGSAQSAIKKTGYSLRDLQLMASNNSKAFKTVADSCGMTSQELQNMMKNSQSLEDFAKVAGISADQFIKAYGEDAVGAIGMFIDGLNDTERNGKSAVEILETMGIKEVRLSNAILALSSSNGILTDSVGTANKAWEENTALTNEANKRYDTTESKLKMAKNSLTRLAISMGDSFLPAIADAAEALANISDKFGQLDPKTQKMIITFAGVAAAVGPATRAIGGTVEAGGKLIHTVGNIHTLIGKFNGGEVAADISKVTGALSNAGGAASIAGTSASGLATTALNVAAPALLAVGAAAAIAYGEYKFFTQYQDEVGESFENVAKKAQEFSTGIENATDLVSNLNEAVVVSNEKQQEVSSRMSEIQGEITKIAETAVEERRGLTGHEIERLEDLFEQMHKMSQAELEIEQAKQTVAMDMAKNAKDMTEEMAQDLIKTATETKESVVAKAKEQYAEELALLRQKYGDKATEDNIAYQKEVEAAQQRYDTSVKSAEKTCADTMTVINQGYYDQHIASNENIAKMIELNNEKEKLEKEHTDRLNQITSDWCLTEEQKTAQKRAVDSEYAFKKREINKQIRDSMDETAQNELGAWVGMVSNTELYGGELNGESQKTFDGMINIISDLPKRAKKKITEMMEGMLQGIQDKEPSLFKKAANIANGVINKLKTVFEIASPSKVMRRLFRQVMDGGILGEEDKADEMIETAEDAAKGVESVFEGIEPSINNTKLEEQIRSYIGDGLPRQFAALKSSQKQVQQGINASYNNDNRQSTYYNDNGVGTLLKVENMYVRSDNDIRELSQQLNDLYAMQRAAKGLKT